MTPLRFCLLLKARVSPLEKGGQSPSGAIHPPSCHYCGLSEPLYAGGGHYDYFSVLIAYLFVPLHSLHGQFWTPFSVAALDTDSSHREMLASMKQGCLKSTLLALEVMPLRARRGLRAGIRLPGQGERETREAGGRAVSPED